MEVLGSLEQSGFGTWVRESESLWAYPMFISLHAIGMAFLVGTSVAIDLRILGFAPRTPLAAMEKFFPVIWFGFWTNALSGVVLFIHSATLWAVSPAFITKMVFVALGMVSARLIKRLTLHDPASLGTTPVPMKDKLLAGASLFLWAGAITIGRLTAYLGPIYRAPS